MTSKMSLQKVLTLFLSLTMAFSPYFPAVMAAEPADEITNVADEFVTQSELFRKQPKEIDTKEEEAPEIVTEEEKKAPSPERGPTFFVEKIQIEGNTLFSTEELSQYTRPFEGREITFQDFRTLSEQITNHYRSRGFTTSRAYIPPQTVENATPVIKIVEGKVGNVFVEGNKHFNKRLYEQNLKWRKDRIFRYQDLENSLYFLNQKPDRRARAYIIAGEEPQTSDIIIKAEEKLPVHGSYEFSNRGTKFTHRARHTLNINHNNFLSLGDSFNGSLALAEEGAFQALSFQYNLPFDATRTTLHVGASFAKSVLVKHLKTFEVEGNSLTITPGITQNFIRTRTTTLDGYLGLEIKDSKTTVGDPKISFDRVRVLKTGPRFSHIDKWGRTFLSTDFHWGIPKILGANDKIDDNASRNKSGGEFWYFSGTAARIQRLPKSSFLITRLGGQFPKDELPSLEQFRMGGAYSVRGYPEGDAVGDYGFNFSSELRVPLLFVPQTWKFPWTQKKIRESVHMVGFFDGGKVYLNKRALPGNEKDRLLMGTGFGVRVDIDETLQVSMDMGFPVGDTSTDKDNPQIHLSVKSGF